MEKAPGMDAVATAARRRNLSSLLAAALTLAAIFATLAVSPAGAATCTAVPNCARVIVIEESVNLGNPDSLTKFGFSADFDAVAKSSPEPSPNDFALASGKSQTINDVRPGSYTITESNLGTYDPIAMAATGYDLTHVFCTESGAQNTTASLAAGTATLNVEANEEIICTFRNTRQGRIIIAKETPPPHTSTPFIFNTNVPKFPRFSLIDNQNKGHDAIPGTYTVTEEPANGWELYDVVCVDTPNELPRDRGASRISSTRMVEVKPGIATTCTFKSRLLSTRLIVEKQTLPDRDTASFGFDTSASATGFSLSDDGTQEFVVTPGTYTVTESMKAGWELTGLTCSDGSPVDPAARTATATISQGETVTCTFTNSKDGALVVQAQTSPAGDLAQFGYSTSLPGDPPFKLAGGTNRLLDVRPGAYTATQDPQTGFRLDSISCTNIDSTADTAARTATFQVDPGETVTCTFFNRAIAGAVAVSSEGAEYAYPGDMLVRTFTVTNAGASPLTEMQIGDDRCAPVTRKQTRGEGGGPDRTPDVLDVSDTWVYECATTAPADGDAQRNAAPPKPLQSTVKVDAKDEFARPVSASARHSTRILHPAVQVDTTGPATAVAGEPVGYKLAVTNPGDTPFLGAYVSASDALCDAPPLLTSKNGDLTPSQHDPGDTWTYACTVQTQLGQAQVDNVGKVTAKDSLGGRDVSDTDPATTQLTQPATPPTPLQAKPNSPTLRRPSPTPAALAIPRPRVAVPTVSAKLRGPSGCVSRLFRATVSGDGIARVDFLLDGKLYRRIKASGNRTKFSIKIDPRHQSKVAHRVSARVRFRDSAKTPTRTLRLVYVSCPRDSVPRFAG
jgi:hypothetical protein